VSAFATARSAITNAVAIDRRGFAPILALRGAAGVAIPFAVGTAVGHPAEGAIAAAGALPAGVAGMGGSAGTSAGVITATALGMAVSTFVGGLAAGHLAPTLVVLAIWGFAAGLTAVLGRDATVVGTQAVMGLVVFGRFPGSVASCGAHAGWVLAGAGLQGLLAFVVRSPQRFATERRLLAEIYRELAQLAREPDHSATEVAAQTALIAERVDRRAPDDDTELLRGLIDDADRIRLELQSLATVAQVTEVRLITAGAAVWLLGLAEAVRSGSPAPGDPSGLDDAASQLHSVRAAAPAGRRGTAVRYADARAAALLGQLRASDRLVDALAGIRRIVLPRQAIGPGQAVLALPRRTATTAQRMRAAAADPRSSAFRHAIRLAVLLPVAEAISHALPWQRGYWVVLTALVVLKPDYAATTQRGIARIVGTGVGVLAAGGLVELVHPDDLALTALVALSTWAAYACFAASYALYSLAITSLVVLLLTPIGGSSLSTVADRGLDTLIGGGLALAGYLVWPTWEGRSLPAAVDTLLNALATYADAVLGHYVDPEGADHEATGRAAVNARRARIAALASLTRAAAEPSRGGADLNDATRRLAAARRIVIALHALRATVDDATEHVAVPEAGPLREAMVAALRATAQHRPAEVADLRAMQESLDADVAGDPHGLHARRLSLLAAYLDPLVDSVDTLAHVSGDPSAKRPHV
jgi:uncharacterized membrane protein YccC